MAPKRLVFLIHGMGEHRPGWSEKPRQKLLDLAASGGAPLTGVDFAEITYDHVFERYCTNFGADAQRLQDFANTTGGEAPGAVAKILGWLATADAEERAFFWSHALDVMLYRFFAIVRRDVRVAVMTQFAEAVHAAKAGGTIVDAFVVAHSLGTAVSLDSLAMLAREPFNGSPQYMADAGPLFVHIFTLANVSRVLHDDVDPYASHVCPASAASTTRKPYCNNFTSFRHVLDPFCWWRSFEPQDWGSDFRNIDTLRHLRAINVHGFEHYLDNPEVHARIINAIHQRRALDPARPYPTLAGACVDELRELGRKIQELPVPTDVPETVIRYIQTQALARKAIEKCAGVLA
jgi:hypothetical protein